MDMLLCIYVNFKIVFLISSNIYCRYTLEFPLYTTYVFSIHELFTIIVLTVRHWKKTFQAKIMPFW